MSLPFGSETTRATSTLVEQIGKWLAPDLRVKLQGLPKTMVDQLEEVRLRRQRPVALIGHHEEWFLTQEGLTKDTAKAPLLKDEDFHKTMQILTGSSLYAYEEELRRAYLTIPGGHRVGFCGRVLLESGQIRGMKEFSGLNIRLARDMSGLSQDLLPYIYDYSTDRPFHTLIVSPPRCGKTTLLRDLTRELSEGNSRWKIPGMNIAVVDERSEIAGSFMGVPQMRIGSRTDVLDACPKVEGMLMLLRSMGPQVIVTDEIGKKADFQAIEEVAYAGVKVVSTIHGYDLADIKARSQVAEFLEEGLFERIIVLNRKRGPGTIEGIYNAKGESLTNGKEVKIC